MADIVIYPERHASGRFNLMAKQLSENGIGTVWNPDVAEYFGISQEVYAEQVKQYGGTVSERRDMYDTIYFLTTFETDDAAFMFIDEVLEHYILGKMMAGK